MSVRDPLDPLDEALALIEPTDLDTPEPVPVRRRELADEEEEGDE